MGWRGTHVGSLVRYILGRVMIPGGCSWGLLTQRVFLNGGGCWFEFLY